MRRTEGEEEKADADDRDRERRRWPRRPERRTWPPCATRRRRRSARSARRPGTSRAPRRRHGQAEHGRGGHDVRGRERERQREGLQHEIDLTLITSHIAREPATIAARRPGAPERGEAVHEGHGEFLSARLESRRGAAARRSSMRPLGLRPPEDREENDGDDQRASTAAGTMIRTEPPERVTPALIARQERRSRSAVEDALEQRSRRAAGRRGAGATAREGTGAALLRPCPAGCWRAKPAAVAANAGHDGHAGDGPQDPGPADGPDKESEQARRRRSRRASRATPRAIASADLARGPLPERRGRGSTAVRASETRIFNPVRLHLFQTSGLRANCF